MALLVQVNSKVLDVLAFASLLHHTIITPKCSCSLNFKFRHVGFLTEIFKTLRNWLRSVRVSSGNLIRPAVSTRHTIHLCDQRTEIQLRTSCLSVFCEVKGMWRGREGRLYCSTHGTQHSTTVQTFGG